MAFTIRRTPVLGVGISETSYDDVSLICREWIADRHTSTIVYRMIKNNRFSKTSPTSYWRREQHKPQDLRPRSAWRRSGSSGSVLA